MEEENTDRRYRPLKPNRSVWVVSGNDFRELSAEELTVDLIGQKAFGLLSIPAEWTLPFVVVDGRTVPSDDAIRLGVAKVGLAGGERVIVRSSGTSETMENRGALSSEACELDAVSKTIRQLIRQHDDLPQSVHWLVQRAVPSKALGHMSNERRLCKAFRDWIVEIEPAFGHPGEIHRIALRSWRKDRRPRERELRCDFRQQLVAELEGCALWVYDRLLRVHVEWVWDGDRVYLVQADEGSETAGGVDPRTIVEDGSTIRGRAEASADEKLNVFVPVDESKVDQYTKLRNVTLYRQLGYHSYSFYALVDRKEIEALLKGRVSSRLKADLATLTSTPFVIRTSVTGRYRGHSQMLPRSEELRSYDEAAEWLLGPFREKIAKWGISSEEICLVGHHFLPAISSAWCRACPDKRRVRVESLWGIPEGLYYYSYDSFDVDTMVARIAPDMVRPSKIGVRERLRYKENFIAPDTEGNWVFQKTNSKSDWSNSMMKAAWVEQVAWDTRRLAVLEGRCVTAMWFVGLDQTRAETQLLPWYHEPAEERFSVANASPRRKNQQAVDFTITSLADKLALEQRLEIGGAVSRVILNPMEESIIRDRDFATQIGELSARHGFVVELSGGVLSHAYYLLIKAGCNVECPGLDFDALSDETLEFNKLVRDKIPDLIVEHGEEASVVNLEGGALLRALGLKAIEEAAEVADAKSNYQVIEEIADLYDVIRELMQRLRLSAREVLRASVRKNRKRGRFRHGRMLEKTSLESIAGSQVGNGLLEADWAGAELQERVIDDEAGVPGQVHRMHLDQREDRRGTQTKELTCTLPIGFDAVTASQRTVTFQGRNGREFLLAISVELERTGSEIRAKIEIEQPPEQLSLLERRDSQ